MTYVKRPGFDREEVTDINSIVYTNLSGVILGRVELSGTTVASDGTLYISTVQDLPPDEDRTRIQEQFLNRELMVVELLEFLLIEQRKTNFLLERISGVDIDAEVFY